jgi:phosphatidylglycerol:prolipoprotein diacylglycerol transferase
MSFHGGVLGVVFSVVIYSLLRKINVLRLADVVCASAPIGLFFGRIANFVNGELYGRASDAMWAVEFPRGGFVPRHPSQLYEAMLEGLVLFLLLMVLYKRPEVRERPGIVAGVFFIFYACARMFIEQFREPDAQVGFLFESVTMGQMLSLPMLLLGCLVVFYSLRKGADISDGKAG